MIGFEIADLMRFDDEALRTFLDPRDGGVDPGDLGVALQGGAPAFAERVAASLPPPAAQRFREALAASHAPDAAAAARRVVDALFWPLLYWHRPDAYEELIDGENLHPSIIETLELDGLHVCDIGAGTGRFTLPAAQRARRVTAVDAVPVLLQRLECHATDAGLRNIETRRGSFAALPLADATVDTAVACSSFTPNGPHGGMRAVREAERVTRPGGVVAVIWPQQPEWLEAAGFTRFSFAGDDVRHFRDVETAERLCRDFYSPEAEAWVRRHRSADVPFRVLNQLPPNDVCVKRRPDLSATRR